MVVEYFSNKGKGNFPVSVAANGEIGLQMVYENPYDLLDTLTTEQVARSRKIVYKK